MTFPLELRAGPIKTSFDPWMVANAWRLNATTMAGVTGAASGAGMLTQVAIDARAESVDHGLKPRRKERVIPASPAQIAQQRVLAVFRLRVSGGVSGSGGRAGKDVRSPVIVAKDFDGFRAERAKAYQQAQQEKTHRLRGQLLAAVVVDGDLQRPQEFLILRSELDLPDPAAPSSFGLGFQFHRFFGLVTIVAFSAFVESDGSFQNQEDVVTGAFDLSNRGGYTVGIGKRLVDRVSQFLHEISQAIVQFIPRFYCANPPRVRLPPSAYHPYFGRSNLRILS